MANLSDFFEGTPLTPGPLQSIVDLLEKVADQRIKASWFRRKADGTLLKKNSAAGDNLHIIGFHRELDKTIKAGDTDTEVSLSFPVSYVRPPVVVASAISPKPLMLSVSNVSSDGFTANIRTVGTAVGDVSLNGISYIAIGARGKSD